MAIGLSGPKCAAWIAARSCRRRRIAGHACVTRLWRRRDTGATVGCEGLKMTQSAQILVVDDDVELRGHIAAYLEQHGLTVSQAAGAAEMDARLSKGDIDLVVLDVMMPGEDGFSICRRLVDSGGP